MTLFICTVGTSLLGGRFDNTRFPTLAAQIEAKLRKDRNETAGTEAFLIRASAEANGLVRAHAGAGDEVALLISDTPEGEACGHALGNLTTAELVCSVRVVRIDGLQVTDGRRFQTRAVDSLFLELDNLTRDRLPDEVRLNATGGFKGTLPYLMLYGMFHGYPVDYVYEFSNTLITLPALPIAFDWPRLATAAGALFAIAADGPLPEARWRELLPKDYWSHPQDYDALFILEDGYVSLSGPGFLLKRQIEEIETSTRVMLSPAATAALTLATGQTRAAFTTMLMRLRNPLARRTYRHAEKLHTSDLVVWKTRRAAAPRMVYWMDGSDAWVAELFANHAEYDHFWKRTARNRADYDRGAFVEQASDSSVPYPELLDAVRQMEAEQDEALLEVRDELRQARLDLDMARALANSKAAEIRRNARAVGEAEGRRQMAKEARRAEQVLHTRIADLQGYIGELESQFVALQPNNSASDADDFDGYS